MTTEVTTKVPGNIWKVLVQEGDQVKKGDILFIMEVMKTEVNHDSPVDGKVTKINKVSEGRPHLVDAIKDGLVNIIFNTTEGEQSIKESFSLRRAALSANIPYYTTLAGSKAATEAIISLNKDELTVKSIQSY